MSPPRSRTSPEFVLTGVAEEVRSSRWSEDAPARVSVHVASYRRGEFLPGLFAALEAQDHPRSDFEVVVVDDASGEATWSVLSDLVRSTPLRALALRLSSNCGPATARNTAVDASHGDVLAFTDDDCLPSPAWLTALVAAIGDRPAVVQGLVEPPPDEGPTAGPWDHTIRVGGPSPFFETCNIAYRRQDFIAAGGFDTQDALLNPGRGGHFGEDAVLGATVVRRGAEQVFAADAVVYHRVLERSLAQHLRAQRKVAGFPGLARRSPIFASRLRHGVFLTRRSAAFDLAVLSVVAAAVSRRRSPLLGTIPWMRRAVDAARSREARPSRLPAVVAGVALHDLVTLVSLAEGSVRHRRPVL